jgi:hypothetical protein
LDDTFKARQGKANHFNVLNICYNKKKGKSL